MYVLHVDYLKDEYDDCSIRGRRWFSLTEAIERLSIHKPVQTAYFEKLMKDKVKCKPYLIMFKNITRIKNSTGTY